MPFLNCPHCTEPAWVVRIIAGSEITCKRCGQAYAPDEESPSGSPSVRTRPVQAPARSRGPAPWGQSQQSGEIDDEEEAGTVTAWQKVRLGISLINAGL